MIENRYKEIKKEIEKISPKTEIVVVTKTTPPETLQELAKARVRHIGENRIADLREKFLYAQRYDLPFEFHLIAPIQTNKLKLLDFPIHYHSLTEIRHLEAMKQKKILFRNLFVQVNISEDENKSGVSVSDLKEFVQKASRLEQVTGLMTILKANLSESETLSYYKKMDELRKNLGLKFISIGMSGDYMLAARAHADYVRIGTAIVGERK